MNRRSYDAEYFNWLCRFVYSSNSTASYDKLLEYLHHEKFTWVIPIDENRALDGLDLRDKYLDIYPYKGNDTSLDGDCSILEMMIALAIKCENHLMYDDDYGDRTGEWFWNMIMCLGLNNMTDENFDSSYVDRKLFIFLSRQYEKNGKGGLFCINNPRVDMRNIEIWYQLNWYLGEILDE